MARTAYCKRCGKEVNAGEICPLCGTRLGKNAAHAAWCVERTPVKDWMYWNSVMRLLLPGALAILVLVLLLEGLSGGTAAVEKMISSGFPVVLGILLATVLAIVFAVLLLQGKELSDFVVDSRGIHETRYLPEPTPLKMLMRMKAPRIPEEAGKVLKLGERHLAWKDVARVQLWPEKCMTLFYAPGWWLRIPVVCTPFTWDDTMDYIREKLGKKKKVRLPRFLRAEAAVSPRNRDREIPRMTEPTAEQIGLEEVFSLPETVPETGNTENTEPEPESSLDREGVTR